MGVAVGDLSRWLRETPRGPGLKVLCREVWQKGDLRNGLHKWGISGEGQAVAGLSASTSKKQL